MAMAKGGITHLKSVLLAIGVFMMVGSAFIQNTPAAIPLSNISPYVQNFNGMGVNDVATLPTDFRVDEQAAARTLGKFGAAGSTTEFAGGANISSGAVSGIYNFGAGTNGTGSADRAVGFLAGAGGTQSGNLYARFVNNIGVTLSGLKISYDVEKYRNGTRSAGFGVQLYYSFDGTNWINAGSNFLVSFPADVNNNGFTNAPGATTSVVNQLLSLSITNGANVFLAWNYSVSSGPQSDNAQGLGIDNISIAVGAPLFLNCSPNLTVTATEPGGAVVSYLTSASGGCSPPATLLGSPPSGSTFPIGTTTVTNTLSDICGATNNCNFTVTVKPPPAAAAPQYHSVTNFLPPAATVYISTAPVFASYAGGIVIRDLRHHFFTQNFPPPPLGALQTNSYISQLDFQVSFDNGATFQPASGTANVTERMNHTSDVAPATIVDTELLQFDVSGGTLPTGMRLRESPTLQSLGQSGVRPVAGGYMISGFFDVFSEVSLDGGQNWTPAQQSGHIELRNDPTGVSGVSQPTQLLLSPGVEYTNTDHWFVLFAQSTVLRDSHFSLVSTSFLPPSAGVTNTQSFNFIMDLQVSVDGGNTYQAVRASAQAQMTVANTGSASAGFYDTEITSLPLNLLINGASVMLRESPTEPSRGAAQITPLADGSYRINSFFDLFTELSLDGGASWSSATNGPARIQMSTSAPERAASTNLLPPGNGSYFNGGQQWFALYANGIILTNVSYNQFTQTQPPPPPGGNSTQTFSSIFSGFISMNGGASFAPFSAPASSSVQINSRADLDTSSTRFFDTELLSLNFTGGSLPAGVLVRESPTKASLGRTSVRTNTITGGYLISSFFDVFSEVSLDGGATWTPGVSAPGTLALAPIPAPINLTCSSNITITTTATNGAVTNFSVSAIGGCESNLTIISVPPSGALFPPGTTTVTTTATDSCGDSNSCSFTVTVVPPVGTEYFFNSNFLPPTNGFYLSAPQVQAQYPNGLMVRNLKLSGFGSSYTPPPLNPTPRSDSYSSMLNFDYSSDNGATYQPVSTTASVMTLVTHTADANNTSYFTTEISGLNMAGGAIMLRESPSLISTGRNTLRPVTGGYMVSSYFDLFTELSLDGGASWAPSTNGPMTITLTLPASTPPSLLISPVILSNGSFEFTYSSQFGSNFTVYASTNLSSWSAIGAASQYSTGWYKFTDLNATNFPRRFYQLR